MFTCTFLQASQGSPGLYQCPRSVGRRRVCHGSVFPLFNPRVEIYASLVAFIPEGLPVAVTLSLAKVAHILSKKNILCGYILFSAPHKYLSNKASGPCPSSRPLALSTSCVRCVYITSLHFNKLMRHSQDKTGTLTQNIMHVENLAIFDSVYESNAFRTVITNSDPPVENNLSQIAAVGAICNATTFDVNAASGSDEKKIQGKGIVGNATGQSDTFFYYICLTKHHIYRRCNPPLCGFDCLCRDYSSQMDQRFQEEFQFQGKYMCKPQADIVR